MLLVLFLCVCVSTHVFVFKFLEIIYDKCPKIWNTLMSDKMACANSAEPDQTAAKEQSDQGLHCLPFH